MDSAEKKLVSVLMSTYKEPLEDVIRSVSSMLGQTYDHLQVIVIVDEPANEPVRAWLCQREREDPRLRVCVNECNRGLVFSLNRALAMAEGMYIARMDADDSADADRIEQQLQYLEENSLDLIGCNVRDIDEAGQDLDQTTRFPEGDLAVKRYLRYGSCLPHPTWLGRREMFLALGGYREIDACEDYDFLARAALAGYKMGVYQPPVFSYRISPGGISAVRRAEQKASLYIVRKYYRRGRTIPLDDYRGFMDGSRGARKKKALRRYYAMSQKIKARRDNKLGFALYGIYMVLASGEARRFLFNEAMIRTISDT